MLPPPLLLQQNRFSRLPTSPVSPDYCIFNRTAGRHLLVHLSACVFVCACVCAREDRRVCGKSSVTACLPASRVRRTTQNALPLTLCNAVYDAHQQAGTSRTVREYRVYQVCLFVCRVAISRLVLMLPNILHLH